MTRDEICAKFIDAVPYTLYPFQEEAILAWFECDGGVLVSAPTGMGKTLIAEAAIFEALHSGKRLYYTTPLIALTDQKFREIQHKAEQWGFPREQIGLITGNRRVNPDATIRVVVAEILLNHLIAGEPGLDDPEHFAGVVMDEFHSFNDQERGVVWELSLVLLPKHARVMLLSATVGNPLDFSLWLRDKHGRQVTLVTSDERRVPLEHIWVEDKLLTELLPSMVADTDADTRSPALVFCFNRDECWDVAEILKGLALIDSKSKPLIEAQLALRAQDLGDGVGPKLRQMLLRGVGVHHAGVLPKHKEIVEDLFHQKLVPFVVCTETLAAGINLPARSVVLSALFKGKRGEKKLIPSATAHQMFGRAGRPQFDTKGYVYAVAHEDDVKINKWKKKYDQIDPNSKDPGLMRMRKELERKRPTRRSNEQYWVQGHFKQLIEAGPAKLFSRSMIPYQVLIFLLRQRGTLRDVRDFLSKRFNTSDRIQKFQEQLDFMVGNLAALGYLTRSEDNEHVSLLPTIDRLIAFRSVDPLFGDFLVQQLNFANFDEKILVLESALEVPPSIERHVRIPDTLAIGPLQQEVLAPLLIQMGVTVAKVDSETDTEDDWVDDDDSDAERPPTLPEMLKIVFESKLANPEPVTIQPKWLAGSAAAYDCEFYKLVRAHELVKQEGLVLRHLLRLVILAGEFSALSEDPDYQRIADIAMRTCQRVDPEYTNRYLAEAVAIRKL